MPRFLIHLLSQFCLRITSSIHSLSMTHIDLQVRLRVTSTSKVGGHWWHLSPIMSDVKSVANHFFGERLSGLTHILEITPPAFYYINDIACFTRGLYFDGESFACGLQYGAGLAMVSTTWRVRSRVILISWSGHFNICLVILILVGSF